MGLFVIYLKEEDIFQMAENNETTPLINDRAPEESPTKPVSKKNRLILGIVAIFGILAITGWTVFRITEKPPLTNDPLKLRLYTHNIRFDNNYNDPNEEKWSKRRQLVTSSIDYNTNSGFANVVCLQEVLHNQLEDILYNLNKENSIDEWTYFGVGRTDGKIEGEYAPILFKKSEWDIVDNRTTWLSESPEVPSRGWDAALERIVTMVTLQSKVNPFIKLNFFNTHFDHKGKKARRESSRLIVDRMKNYNDYPSFLCGDFNTKPTDEPYHILKLHGFKDSRTLIDKLHSYGHTATFTGFDRAHEDTAIIDYIWGPYFAENGNQSPSILELEDINFYDLDLHESYKIMIEQYAVLHSRFHDIYMSDHRPVSADYIVYKD